MNKRVIKHGYKVAESLFNLVEQEILPGLDIDKDHFWKSATQILDTFIPQNKALLEKREELQRQIDEWHQDPNNQPICQDKYQTFLSEIGYLEPEVEDFSITTENVDDEVATIAGPQLVVPVMNARFALNAANARWGSLYDALYGTNAIPQTEAPVKGYNPERGNKVIAYGREFLDSALPLSEGSHTNAVKYFIDGSTAKVSLENGSTVGFKDESSYVGYTGEKDSPNSVLLKHNGLHIEIQIDADNLIGKTDKANVKDIVLESALSTIQDCEDSIAAVDAEDKVAVYSNWLGLMKGDLAESLEKNGKTITRTLNNDREFTSADGGNLTLSGRSLLFVRNVGHLMTNDVILTSEGEEVPEGLVDGIITSLISLHDLKGNSPFKNSNKGSIYIVKPKMHGPQEVKFADEYFKAVESAYGLEPYTIKIGIMDEERRTSANLKNCIHAAKNRVAFINTGFLDRTGDEIHTSMLAGPVAFKDLMKNEKWINAYETRNVNIGLKAGLKGKAQIGKGMWACPDEMADMMEAKIGHPKAGANCAWVPSPTAATLHVMHYHKVSVSDVQDNLLAALDKTQHEDGLRDLLTIPLLEDADKLTPEAIQQELDNNVQGLLGYVVRWVDQGVGCSKVPDIDNIGRMEDRATLRISSQHICNWLEHGILTKEQVIESLERMAVVVDEQNSGDTQYINMAPNFAKSIAFQAGADLIFEGKVQPSGYTEPLLHLRRRELKAAIK